jgi:hypothetical protein
MTARAQKFISVLVGAVILLILIPFLECWWWGGKIRPEVKAKSAMKQAYAIHQALYAAAQDNVGGEFPSKNVDGAPCTTSNEAFRQLFIRGLIDDEKIFFVQGSAWHAGKKTDGDVGDVENKFSKALEKNENTWAYVSGLNTVSSPVDTPIVTDGSSEVPGVWGKDPSKKGGIWKGRFRIVVRVGGQAKVWDVPEVDRPIPLMDQIKAVPGAKFLNPDG